MGKYVGGQQRAREKAYRSSDAGRLARRMYLLQPEVKMKMKLRRQIKRKLKMGEG